MMDPRRNDLEGLAVSSIEEQFPFEFEEGGMRKTLSYLENRLMENSETFCTAFVHLIDPEKYNLQQSSTVFGL